MSAARMAVRAGSRAGGLALALAVAVAPAAHARTLPSTDGMGEETGARFAAWMRDNHVPGLAWGVVQDGRLVASGGLGVRDLDARAPVDARTRFRIASMSKAFTALAILKLRDEGKLRLDDLAERYVPELRGWHYPTADAPRIRVRNLLTHSAGFVDDNPWGDRQQPLSEESFTAMLRAGVPFSRVAQEAMEYSNFGYATLGRIVTNVTGMPYQRYITQALMRPLGMAETSYDVLADPPGTRAIGYRWEDHRWSREPDMADGAFGAMGGVETTTADYAKWVAFLLSAWPARDGAETGPVKRSTVREIVQGSNFATLSDRRAGLGEGTCPQATAYGMGWRVIQDCALSYVTHTGGYPGYGSVVMLVPQSGVGVFAFASRTYAAPVAPAYQALLAWKRAGRLAPRAIVVTPRLAAGYEAVRRMWAAGDVTAAKDSLAVNSLMDRSAGQWRADLERLKGETGHCDTSTPISATTWMAGQFAWRCERRALRGSILLAPTSSPTIQELKLAPAAE